MMKVAPTIVFLFKDSDGLATAIADALHPTTGSSFHRLEDSFELSLARYGIQDVKAKGNLIHFIDNDSNYQVSVLLMDKYEPPNLVCALSEVLTQIIGEASAGLLTLIVPFIGTSTKLKWESRTSTKDDSKVSIYGERIGPETDITRAIASRTQKPPSSLQVHYEPLACFLQLVSVLKLPTSVLIGQRARSGSDKAAEGELEILYEIGELLASTTCLCFLREKLIWNPENATKDSKEPWRALYG
ncbi:hypothetical protein P3X46_012028 [Hevea brasiliensis]|uniref:DUF7894 domain-containing protein n=1 Tax=Hevea brasiliensis TaxID=3981 RepID=A0ABQ9MA28_HEVBR|nr:uncharacterized protein LOC110648836 [Hevea brasiliensis]KAJ9176748.1 hypothetical protein P3X46_012028 [Hevea brasiliensis]